jgi:uncharacterized protein (DUF2147 family)
MFNIKTMVNKIYFLKTTKHKIMKRTLMLLAFAFVAFNCKSQVKDNQIKGEWMSPKKDTRVLIYKEGEKYYGKITWGTGIATKDEKNPQAELRNRELIGLVILSNFSYNGDDTWAGGSIYDPREGKTYDCKMTLKEEKTLSIRGYVGISLFGRSEVWTKYK